MKQVFPVIHVSVSQQCVADESGLGVTALLCTVGLGLSGGASVSTRIRLPPESGGWPKHTLLLVTAEHHVTSRQGTSQTQGQAVRKLTLWWRGGGVKLVEHHWEFQDRSRTTASDRNKGFGAGTEPHAVVGAGAEVSIWPSPLCPTLSLWSSGPAAGRESKTDRGSHQRPPGAQVSLCLQAQSHRDGQGGWRSC